MKKSSFFLFILTVLFLGAFLTVATEALAAPVQFSISVDPVSHKKFGLYYPVTYKFRLPAASRGLVAQVGYPQGGWNNLPEKKRGDQFNGIDAVRFDYSAGFAYISVRFSPNYDSFTIRIIDGSGQTVPATFDSIPKYYDERTAAVSIVLDDWNIELDEKFDTATRYLQADNLYFSVAIIAADVNYQSLQQHIDLFGDLMEVASHTLHHPYPCNADSYAAYGYDAEAAGSRDALVANLHFNHAPYVPLFVEPCGYSDDQLQAAVTAANYLVERCSNNSFNSGANFIAWEPEKGRYGRAAETFDDGAAGDTPGLVTEGNSTFDKVLALGGIYTLVDHPRRGYWYDNSYLLQHLDYVKGRSDVWYVPLGQMYEYHFLQEMRGNLRIQQSGAAPLQAAFTAAPLAGSAPLSVTFTDTSTGSVAAWSWDFGDSGSSRTRNPVHVYSKPGTFKARLTVSGTDGSGTSSTVRTVTVISSQDSVPPVVTAFRVPKTSNSRTVPITSFTATDNVGVTGYLITEAAVRPALNDPGWNVPAAAVAPSPAATAGASPHTLPSPWLSQDVGSVGEQGSAGFDNGVFTISGSGYQTTTAEDAFRYLYRTTSGDFQITARVAALQGDCSKGGAALMIRQSLAADAVNAALALGVDGAVFSSRSVEKGSTRVTAKAGVTAPYWVRLVRQGEEVYGYLSADGIKWELIDSDNVPLTGDALVGMTAASGASAAICTAVVDEVN